jgi:hypothetical protein
VGLVFPSFSFFFFSISTPPIPLFSTSSSFVLSCPFFEFNLFIDFLHTLGVASWVPYSLIAEYVSFISISKPTPPPSSSSSTSSTTTFRSLVTSTEKNSSTQPSYSDLESARLVSSFADESHHVDGDDHDEEGCVERRQQQQQQGQEGDVDGAQDNGYEENEGDDEAGSLKAGLVLGLHNVYIVVPQFVSTLMTSLVFLVLDVAAASEGGGGGDDEGTGKDAFGTCFRMVRDYIYIFFNFF